MKKLLLSISFIFVTFCLSAQKLEDINDLMGLFKYREAKEAIDKYLQNPKKANDAEGWYMKGRICNSLSKDSSISLNDKYELKKESFKAFKKYQELDKKDVRMTMEDHVSYFDLYGESYNLAINGYNEKDYNLAFLSFSQAHEIKDYILGKNYTNEQLPLLAFDTSLITNTAVSAINAKRFDDAMVYYKKITDAEISGPDFTDPYIQQAEYYYKTGNSMELLAIVNKGRKLYPDNDYWFEIQLRPFIDNKDEEHLNEKFDELLKANPESFYLTYMYGVELSRQLNDIDSLSKNDVNKYNRLFEVLINAVINEKGKDASAIVFLASKYYRYAYQLQTTIGKIKSKKPEAAKLKSVLNDIYKKAIDECVVAALKSMDQIEAMTVKSSMNKTNYKIMGEYLKDIYNTRNEKPKADQIIKRMSASQKW